MQGDGTVVLSTLGSRGDLYPVLSVARALCNRGIAIRLALSPDDCAVAAEWGLPAVPTGPSEAETLTATGLTRDELAARVLTDPTGPLRDIAIPMLPALVREMTDLCAGASCVVGTAFALAAPMAAERAGLPYVPLVLQPMLAFSPLDPPRAGPFRLAVPRPRTAPARLWNRGIVAAARAVLRVRLSPALNRVRADLGLPRLTGTPLLDHGARVPFRLGLWDPAFSPLPADRRDGWHATGFPPPPPGDLAEHVRAWLDAGPPPLVVTLGSIAQGLAGETFWTEAADTARALGLRAVLIHGEATAPSAPDLLTLRYVPHATLFPRAAAIVHHGGIGTTAEALRSGRPQLVVPVGGDQADNAARLVRLGLAATLPPRRFNATRAASSLAGLLERFDGEDATRLAEEIRDRDGAAEAARRIATLLP